MTEICNDHECQAFNLANIIDILDSTDIPQIKYDLAQWDWGDEDVKRLVGKCALGVIQCEVGIAITEDNMNDFNFESILSNAGLEEELIQGGYPSLLTDSKMIGNDRVTICIGFNDIPDSNGQDGEGNNNSLNLAQLIYGLNDSGLTFHEISEFLEVTFGDRV